MSKHTTRCLCVLGLRLLLPLGLGLLNQALLAGIFAVGLSTASGSGERGLVVETVDETSHESRVTENLYRKEGVAGQQQNGRGRAHGMLMGASNSH